jgi:phage terminase large subunit-like protein
MSLPAPAADHPLIPLPKSSAERARMVAAFGGAEKINDWFARRGERIGQAERDPLRFGWETERVPQPDGSEVEYFPHWRVLRALWSGTFLHEGETLPPARDILLLGGKRASKTEPAAKFAVEALYTPQPGTVLESAGPLHLSGRGMVTNAGRTVWCWIMDETASIDRQQKYIYKYLPPEHRDLGKQGTGNIKYQRKTGFSERCLVLPCERPEQASLMRFFTYHQFRQDPDVAEGDETDFIWLDEPPPEELLETLRYRNLTRNGKLFVTFNPKNGYTVSVGQYLEGARLLLDRLARFVPPGEVWVKGCRPGHMPYVLRCHQPGRYVVAAYTELNPFNDADRLAAEMAGAKMAQLKIHFYGWPERLEGVAFPRFGDVHTVKPDQIPAEGTDYVMIDPAGDRNWFILWFRVDVLNRLYVQREWPDASYGEWAVPSRRPDGARGPAQTLESGKGVAEYKRLLLQLSGWERDPVSGSWTPPAGRRPHEFAGDPRGFGTQVPGNESGTSLRDLMLDTQKSKDGKIIGPGIDLVLSPACGVQEGFGLINDALYWNEEQPLSEVNRPRLFVSGVCQNLIYCLRTHTGLDGEKGASKDPIDCLRYALKSDVRWMDPERKTEQRTGGY